MKHRQTLLLALVALALLFSGAGHVVAHGAGCAHGEHDDHGEQDEHGTPPEGEDCQLCVLQVVHLPHWTPRLTGCVLLTRCAPSFPESPSRCRYRRCAAPRAPPV